MVRKAWLLALAMAVAVAACSNERSGSVIVPGGGGGGGRGGGGGGDAGSGDGAVGDGGSTTGVTTLAQTPTVGALAADASNIYWSSGVTLWRVPKAGGAKVMVATATTAIDGLTVTNTGGIYFTTADGGVWKVGSSSAANQAQVDTPGSLVVVGTTMFVAAAGGIEQVVPSFSTTALTGSVPAGNLVASGAGDIFWAEAFVGTGNIETIAAGDPPFSEAVVANDSLGSPVNVALGGSNLFWTSHGTTAAIRRISAATRGGTGQLVIGNLSQLGAIASDGINVYFATGGTIGRVPAASTGTTTAHVMASGQQQPVAILVDSNSVYWGNAGDGTIQKSAK